MVDLSLTVVVLYWLTSEDDGLECLLVNRAKQCGSRVPVANRKK